MGTIKASTSAILAISLLTGTAVGVLAQDEGSEPRSTAFTGSFTTQSDLITEGTTSETDGVQKTKGHARHASMVSSDPRLTGPVTFTDNWLVDLNVMAPDYENFNVMVASTLELTNDGGSWLGEARTFGNIELDVNTGMIVFEGRGGYDGLSAYLLVDWQPSQEFVGTIFQGELPDFPEPYAE